MGFNIVLPRQAILRCAKRRYLGAFMGGYQFGEADEYENTAAHPCKLEKWEDRGGLCRSIEIA